MNCFRLAVLFGFVVPPAGATEQSPIAVFRKAVELEPSAQAYKNLWRAYAEKGEIEAASLYSVKACALGDQESCSWARGLQDHPAKAMAEVARGNELMAKGQSWKALARYKRALELDPRSSEASANAG